MNYKIAIPSYARETTIVEKTLAYLLKTNVALSRVTIFVSSGEEKKLYQKKFGPNNHLDVVVGVPTLKGQRKFIRNYYPKGTCVFSIDDDIKGIYQAHSIKVLKLVTDLNGLIQDGFDVCQKFGATLWGMNAVCNPYFMYGKPLSSNLKYIVGAAYGEIVDPQMYFDTYLEDKEDFERTILHYKASGKVLRFNDVSFETNYYKEPGGMQMTRTKERVTESAHYLLSMYPKYCTLNTKKKNKEFTEIRLLRHG